MSKPNGHTKKTTSIDLTPGKKVKSDTGIKEIINSEKLISEMKNKDLIYKKISNFNENSDVEISKNSGNKSEWNLPKIPKVKLKLIH